MRKHLLSDFCKGDTVRTRSGRLAIVRGFDGDAVVVQTTDDGEEMTLLPALLDVVAPAPRRAFPARFFADGGVVKAMAR